MATSRLPPLDLVVHNSVFLVAHFHNVLIPGLLSGMIAGYQYWFPKAFGFRLSEGWGKVSFGCWVVGFYLAFMPLYVLGLGDMARRTQSILDADFQPWLTVAVVGAFILLAALVTLFVQLFVSVRDREQNRVPVGDPWDARGLEWSIPAPPPSTTSPPSRPWIGSTPSTGSRRGARPTSPPRPTLTSWCRRTAGSAPSSAAPARSAPSASSGTSAG
ncbi:cbb3-type cytochrome c oxidase subunit I [Methylobacterium persicinum]